MFPETIEQLIPEQVSIQEMIGSISGNLIDRPEVSFVHNEELNEKYYNLVKGALLAGNFNIKAMVDCMRK